MPGLYIHIPFCHSKCAYCDFYSMPLNDNESALVDALLKEYTIRHERLSFNTIYLGGGTPSILSNISLARLIDGLNIETDLEEFTIEANPEDITVDKVMRWKELGINRVSMGVQSFVDSELSLIGRRHSSIDAVNAIKTLQEGGLKNFSLDLIYGLPLQTTDSWKHSLDTLLNIHPTHFSAYMLSYEPHTRLMAMFKTGKIKVTSEDNLIKMYDYLCKAAKDAGYDHYEISNFALRGMQAKHNSSYWDGTPYLGIGPSAHSFIGEKRYYNPSNLKEYLSCLNSGKSPSLLDDEDANNRFNDMIMTSLRTSKGLNLRKLDDWRRTQLIKDANSYLKSGHLIEKNDYLTITEKSWLISDSIISNLFQV